MARNFILLNMKINGIKSIDKQIEIQFTNSTIKKNFDNTNSHVKGIYGSNGAGKTGIVYAVEIFKNLMLYKNYLAICNNNGSLKSLVNQTTKEFEIDLTYAMVNSDSELLAIYEQVYMLKEDNDEFIIYKDSLYKISGYNIADETKKKTIYEIVNGKICSLIGKDKENKMIEDWTKNLLGKQSLHQILASHIYDDEFEEDFAITKPFMSSFAFGCSLNIVLQDDDKNYINFENISKTIDKIGKYRENSNENMFFSLLSNNRIPSLDVDYIKKEDYNEYSKNIEEICAFLKVFKTDLERIDIIKYDNGDNYECQNVMVYKDGRNINKKLESIGVKKLIKLYSALCDIENGKIVFIDEFDANIHDVLLTKLVEYFTIYAEGQFVFTIHNLGPMSVLKKQKHSIDFLSNDSEITSWSSSGNYDPASLYSKGLIEKSPFNLSSSSFIGAFGKNE